jgi:23S rRNA (uracil1939-C5)-methyltransferase
MQEVSDALEVESLDLEGQGVARRPDGKVVFVEGALPGERVRVQVLRRKNNWEQGTLETLLRESSQRVRPPCPHFGLHAGACGGCKMQHLHPAAQVAVKQRVLEDDLWHLAKVRPARVLRPIEGPAWGYRWRARLSVRHVAKKGTVLVGFHERKSRYVADMKTCPVLPPAVSGLLVPLRELVGSLDQRDRIPQIELAVGDAVLALVLRHLEPLSAADQARLRAFATEHAGIGLQWWLQPKGPETVHLLDEGGAQLGYALPEFDVFMPYRPTDFTQVNPGINRVLVARAVALLDPQPGERTIDWFCGLGNFSLPLARRGSTVLGVEGSATLVARARENAQLNALAERTTFEARDLFKLSPADLEAAGSAQRWLVDPPREGAFALVKALAELRRDGPRSGSVPGEEAGGWQPPRRIVYVSCNPATLARDAGLLVHQAGYRCSAAGAVNMFPHTAHVESVAVFDLDPEAVFGAELGTESGAEPGAEG